MPYGVTDLALSPPSIHASTSSVFCYTLLHCRASHIRRRRSQAASPARCFHTRQPPHLPYTQAAAASSLPGKVLGLWPPVTAFVAMGLEHCVANMFLVPMGMVLGAAVSQQQLWLGNLLPVTIGNVLGGVVFMAGLYTACYRPKST